jgi:hypothetical protein
MYSKFGNKPRKCRQGVIHQSTLECHRCDELHILQAGGLIFDLKAHPQPAIRLDVNGEHVCTIIPDFFYMDEKGNEIYEDTKGHRTAEWMLKRKLLWALKRIEIVEVRR